MDQKSKRVKAERRPLSIAIIGTGPGGLAALKTALESGLEAVAFERDSQIGGVWNCPDKTKAEHSCVQFSTITNASKHMICFSDFPIPKDWPHYLPASKMLEYLEMYATHFKLVQRIRFNTTVLELKPTPDYEEQGKWEVSFQLKSGDVRSEIFDAVMVCSGINNDPVMPDIPGQENFKGKILHSKEYHTFHPFEGKRVVVVGNGNTGGDISCELGRHASQVYFSARRGTWLASRLQDRGLPADIVIRKRVVQQLPQSVLGRVMKHKLEQKYSHANLGLKPDELPNRQIPIISDELPIRIVTGSVITKPGISSVDGNNVSFQDGTRISDIDAIILATGFEIKFSILPDELQPEQGCPPLYKYVFPPSLKHSTLAVIGAIRTDGGVLPLMELQARWAVQVFTGKCALPDADRMLRDVQMTKTKLNKTKCHSTRNSNFVGCMPYSQEIARLAGVNPKLWSLFFKDPCLALRCYFGPCVPAQYRLRGPGAWQGARNVIDSVKESLSSPRQRRNHPAHF